MKKNLVQPQEVLET